MQDPVYNLKLIIDGAIDLYRIVNGDDRYAPEEIVRMGQLIKTRTEGLVDMAWHKTDAKDWDEKHPGHVGTKL